jgi:NAD(P)-dependent dehydrogenase (short-subunit alcohol dehydrogenase family)
MPAEQAATHDPAKPRARVPLGRVLNPLEIAGLAVDLGFAESIGMTGQSIHVDGGMVLS